MGKISIIDDILPIKEFSALKEIITSSDFPWNFSKDVVNSNEKKPSPGMFVHVLYENSPYSPNCPPWLVHLLKYLDIAVLYRIRANLNHRLPAPFYSEFHIDTDDFDVSQWTTSILYINTNNGYTELESGEIIESVENRLATFPLGDRHRVCTQTDEQARYVINFNYLKNKEHG